MHNAKRQKNKSINLKSNIDDYHILKIDSNTQFVKYKYRVKILLQIYSKDKSRQLNFENIQSLAKQYEVHRSDMYKITTFINTSTTIVDDVNKITLKKSTGETRNKAISDMLDLAQLKGWSLGKLIIEGDENFIKETKKQIRSRSENVIKVNYKIKPR